MSKKVKELQMENKHKEKVAAPKKHKSILVNGKLTNEAQAVFEASFAESQKAAKPLVDKIRASRRLGKDDFTVRMNTHD